jgi:hypothetical protein
LVLRRCNRAWWLGQPFADAQPVPRERRKCGGHSTTYANEQTAMAMRATHAGSREDFFKTCEVATDLILKDIADGLAQSSVLEDRRVLAALFLRGKQILQQRALKKARG